MKYENWTVISTKFTTDNVNKCFVTISKSLLIRVKILQKNLVKKLMPAKQHLFALQ